MKWMEETGRNKKKKMISDFFVGVHVVAYHMCAYGRFYFHWVFGFGPFRTKKNSTKISWQIIVTKATVSFRYLNCRVIIPQLRRR